ncbi:MAG: hypothetical protein K2Y39_26790 [Candidatus Obscuribacterales bacterium]|nr:hypothetical protein [Candidatus Obscuribacterales bacterium]
MSNSNQHHVRNVIILTDIDDTLCHSVGKFRKYVGDEKALGDACVYDASGKPLSYRSRAQETFLDWLSLAATVIPITGRSTESFRHVELGFSSFAITCFGATILHPDGTPDPVWLQHVTAQSALALPALEALHAVARSSSPSDRTKASIVSDNGLPLFLKVHDADHNQSRLDAVGDTLQEFLPRGWRMHANEGQLCAYPAYLDKVNAARYFLDNLAGPHSIVVGCGDSLSDTSFISVCDFMVAPIQSQIFNSVKSE